MDKIDVLTGIVKEGFKKLGLDYEKIAEQAEAIAKNDGYNGEFPQGVVGASGSDEWYISTYEDNIRKYGIGTSNFRGSANIEQLWMWRQRRFAKKSPEQVSEYERLNPYPLDASGKEVGATWMLNPEKEPGTPSQICFYPGDPKSTVIPREIIP